MKKRNWFWGIFFILATILLIASQLGSFMEIGFWSLFGTILLVAIIIQSAFYLVWPGIFIPVALIYLIFQQPMGWPYLAPWILIIAAVLLSIGFHMLFRARLGKWRTERFDGSHATHGCNGGVRPDAETTENSDDNHPESSVKFGNSTRYLRADCLRSGRFSCSFGNLEVYFDEASLSPDGADILLDCSFGSIKLFLPSSWQVSDQTHSSMGGVSFTGRPQPGPDAPRLTLSGSVSMGGVEVVYV